MKNLPISFLLIFLSSILLPCKTFSQSHQGFYMHIDYILIEGEQKQAFEDQISLTFKPIQKLRRENGYLKDWYIYKVAYPGTKNSFYNYVVITISSHLSDFEDIHSQVATALETNETILGTYRSFLTPNHSELWRISNSVLKQEGAKPSRYISMNYMDVKLGREYEYQMFEDEVARPLHEQRMELDRMEGWELFALIVPGGTEYGYNFATGDYYKNLHHIEFGFTDELIRQSHPNTNVNEFFDNIYRTRDLVRSEIWELIDYLD